MKISQIVAGSVAGICLAVGAWADDLAEFQPLMQSAAASCKQMKAGLDAGDAKAAATHAAATAENFTKIEKWWAAKGKKDAAGWAADAAAKAKHIETMAKGGDTAGGAAHFKMLTGNCGSCHDAYRDKDAAGKWKIKM